MKAIFPSKKKRTCVVILYIFFLGMLLKQPISAQQLKDLEATEVQPDYTSIPVFASYPDYAAIIISSSLTHLKFESNIEIIADLSEPASGEYRLIIPPYRQNIRINATGFKQLRINIAPNGAKDVSYFTVEPLSKKETLIPTVFSIEPIQASDANVFIDDQAIDIKTRVDLKAGTHRIRIEKSGWRTIEEEIVISENMNAIRRYKLEPVSPQTITVTSSPTDATFQLDNTILGTTNLQFFELPGEYIVNISKIGYKSLQEKIIISEDSVNNFHFSLEKFGGNLLVNTNSDNAIIFLNNKEIDFTNNAAIVPPGIYTLKIEAQGYETHFETIEVVNNETLVRVIKLAQKFGSLQFSIKPIDAQVILTDLSGTILRQWQGAQYISSLPIGNYILKTTASDFEPYTRKFTIKENQLTEINARMVSITEAGLEKTYTPNKDKEHNDDHSKRKITRYKKEGLSGLYLHYNLFELNGNPFQTNVIKKESNGYGIGFFRYKNNFTSSLDLIYNSYTLVENDNFPNKINSYNASGSLLFTVPLGPIRVSYGAGFDFTQYVSSDKKSYYHTNDTFTSLQFAFKPESWNIGFMVDTRKSWDTDINKDYKPWTQQKYSLIISF